MIDQKTLKSLIKLMIENDLTELDVADGDEKVRLCRGGGDPRVHYESGPAVREAEASRGSVAVGAVAGAGLSENERQGLKPIISPMVGSFYAAPSPDAEPFVNVGQRVEEDAVVCIIEAMKVFNEIKADIAGTIEKVLVDNGQAVEFGQPLFLVRVD